MIIINNASCTGKININGREISLHGKSLEMRDGQIIVDGKPIEEYDEGECPIIKIEITGNVDNINTENGEVTVNGRVGSICSKNGNVKCETVEGNIDSKNGNIYCHTVNGDVETKNGNIIRQSIYK